VARLLWGTPWRKLAPVGALFLTVEVAFFSSNIAKVTHGAWLPLAVGLLLSLVMINWRRGQMVVTRKRVAQEGELTDFLDRLAKKQPPVIRVPGVAVFLNPNPETTPLALRAEVQFTRTLHERVVVVSIDNVGIPNVDPFDCLAVRQLGHGLFKILHVTIRMGYRDKLSVPDALVLARKQGLLERNLDLEHAVYFLSRITINSTSTRPLQAIREKAFIFMARNAASPIDHFGLPPNRTVLMGTQVTL
jgi:KUP system potassium uptake protein